MIRLYYIKMTKILNKHKIAYNFIFVLHDFLRLASLFNCKCLSYDTISIAMSVWTPESKPD